MRTPDPHRSRKMYRTLTRARRWMAVVAAWPVLQGTGCIPDPIGALNFELQSLVNSVLINAVQTIVSNFLRL